MCDECAAISREIRDAMADLRPVSDRMQPDAFRVVEALLRGTREDAELVEEFLSAQGQFASQPSSRNMHTMGLKFSHEWRTGHRIDWNPWGWGQPSR